MKIQKAYQKGLAAFGLTVVMGALAALAPAAANAGLPPAVTNVVAAQQALPSKLVNISYTLSDPDSTSVSITILVSTNSGATWTVPATSFTGDYGPNVSVNATPTTKAVVWNAGADFNGQFSTTCRVRVIANDDNYAVIPAGTFSMGDNLDGETDAQPVHLVTNSAFYIDTNLVTGAGWTLVYTYAVSNGYAFDNSGSSQGLNYPIQSINWFDAVKWCNARSEMLKAVPVYYTDATMTNVYRSGTFAPYVNTNANGYRLPTEAEWEKAARGGLAGQRFPWGNTINETQANYFGNTNNAYDGGPAGYNTNFVVGSLPYTSPVGFFAPNAYGMYDMIGNVFEWCADLFNAYTVPAAMNPRADAPGNTTGNRVVRAGSYNFDTSAGRNAARGNVSPGTPPLGNLGFRCARSF